MAEPTRILIADDNESLARSMSLVLERHGHVTATAKDGLEAVRLALAGRFDLIFLDLKMPGMDGIEALREIHAARPDTTVVLMSAYAMEHGWQHALEQGASDVLHKPLDLPRVLLLVEQSRDAPTPLSVLLVDDHQGSCDTLSHILQRKGCEVVTANTGEQAIARAREQPFHLIFIDMKLPTIDGLETYLGLKQHCSEAAVVLMTGYWEEKAEAIHRALRSSAVACMEKPLDLEEVLRLVRRQRRRLPTGEQSSARVPPPQQTALPPTRSTRRPARGSSHN